MGPLLAYDAILARLRPREDAATAPAHGRGVVPHHSSEHAERDDAIGHQRLPSRRRFKPSLGSPTVRVIDVLARSTYLATLSFAAPRVETIEFSA